MALGIMMGGGCSEAFYRGLDSVIGFYSDDEEWPLTYLEIGVARGETFGPAVRHLQATGHPFRAIGLDIPGGWSLDLDAIRARVADLHYAEIILRPSQEYLTKIHRGPIHFLFVDGCHGRPCVMGDFLAAEKFIPLGGVVYFHDTAPEVQGILGPNLQPHCGTGIDVRSALEELGLLKWNQTQRTRPGWRMGEEVGYVEGKGYGCMVFHSQ